MKKRNLWMGCTSLMAVTAFMLPMYYGQATAFELSMSTGDTATIYTLSTDETVAEDTFDLLIDENEFESEDFNYVWEDFIYYEGDFLDTENYDYEWYETYDSFLTGDSEMLALDPTAPPPPQRPGKKKKRIFPLDCTLVPNQPVRVPGNQEAPAICNYRCVSVTGVVGRWSVPAETDPGYFNGQPFCYRGIIVRRTKANEALIFR